MLGSWLNLVTTVIGFGMSTTFVVFVCARLLCGRVRSADSRTTTDPDMRSDIFDQPEHAISGLEPVLVAAIPTMKYKREDFSSTEDAQCPICLGEYEEKEMLRVLPQCHHSFHLSCIDLWLQKQSTCPICRLPLNESLEAKYSQILNDRASIDQYRRWLLPSHQRSDHTDTHQETSGSISITIGGSRGEGHEDRI